MHALSRLIHQGKYIIVLHLTVQCRQDTGIASLNICRAYLKFARR